MKNFIDQAGGLWAQDKLMGKWDLCSPRLQANMAAKRRQFCRFTPCFCISDSLLSGCPSKGQLGIKDVHGITPYGATTIVGADGARMPSPLEIEAAHYRGRHVARIADACHRVRRPGAGMRVVSDVAAAAP
jgi:NAD(P)H dehydrogenase (quinone)